jgi:hypothetical protein
MIPSVSEMYAVSVFRVEICSLVTFTGILKRIRIAMNVEWGHLAFSIQFASKKI